MAKTNYGYEKRQRDLARKKKQEEKLQRKREKKAEKTGGTQPGQDTAEGNSPAGANDTAVDIGGEGGK